MSSQKSTPTVGCGRNLLTDTYTHSSIFGNGWLPKLQKPVSRRFVHSPNHQTNTRTITSKAQLKEHLKMVFNAAVDIPASPMGGAVSTDYEEDNTFSNLNIYYVFELTEERYTELLPAYTPSSADEAVSKEFAEIAWDNWNSLKRFGDSFGHECVEEITYGRKIVVVAQLSRERSEKMRAANGEVSVKAASAKVSTSGNYSLNVLQDEHYENVSVYTTCSQEAGYQLIQAEVGAIRRLWHNVLNEKKSGIIESIFSNDDKNKKAANATTATTATTPATRAASTTTAATTPATATSAATTTTPASPATPATATPAAATPAATTTTTDPAATTSTASSSSTPAASAAAAATSTTPAAATPAATPAAPAAATPAAPAAETKDTKTQIEEKVKDLVTQLYQKLTHKDDTPATPAPAAAAAAALPAATATKSSDAVDEFDLEEVEYKETEDDDNASARRSTTSRSKRQNVTQILDEMLKDELVPLRVKSAPYSRWIQAPGTLWTFRMEEMVRDTKDHLNTITRVASTTKEYRDLVMICLANADKLDFSRKVMQELDRALQQLNYFSRVAANQYEFFTSKWFLCYLRDTEETYSHYWKRLAFSREVLTPLKQFSIPSGVVHFRSAMVLLADVPVFEDKCFSSKKWWSRVAGEHAHNNRHSHYFDLYLPPGTTQLYTDSYYVDPTKKDEDGEDALNRFVDDVEYFKGKNNVSETVKAALKDEGILTLRALYIQDFGMLFRRIVKGKAYTENLKTDQGQPILDPRKRQQIATAHITALLEPILRMRELAGHRVQGQAWLPTEVDSFSHHARWQFDLQKRATAFRKRLLPGLSTQRFVDLKHLGSKSLNDVYVAGLRVADADEGQPDQGRQLRFRVYASMWKHSSVFKNKHASYVLDDGATIIPPTALIQEEAKFNRSLAFKRSTLVSAPSWRHVTISQPVMQVHVPESSMNSQQQQPAVVQSNGDQSPVFHDGDLNMDPDVSLSSDPVHLPSPTEVGSPISGSSSYEPPAAAAAASPRKKGKPAAQEAEDIEMKTHSKSGSKGVRAHVVQQEEAASSH